MKLRSRGGGGAAVRRRPAGRRGARTAGRGAGGAEVADRSRCARHRADVGRAKMGFVRPRAASHMAPRRGRPGATLLDDLVRRGFPTLELVVVDGAPGLEKALAALWPDMAVKRCTVHKHRNLLAHAPERLHEEISNDYRDMIYAATRGEVETRRKAFIRKWRLKCRVVADSLEEAGDKLFTFHAVPAEPMEIDPNLERDRAIARGVQAPDQDFRPCCSAPKPPPCCSGRCSPQDRSSRATSTDGRPSPRNQRIRSLTSPHDRIPSCRPKTRQSIPT